MLLVFILVLCGCRRTGILLVGTKFEKSSNYQFYKCIIYIIVLP